MAAIGGATTVQDSAPERAAEVLIDISAGTASKSVGKQLIQAMASPDFYPHPCDSVEFSQTLMSWLLFAGQFVYKIKKPIRSPFFDASTPAKRYQLCRDELSTNRRLAPDLYLGVIGIRKERNTYTLVSQLDSLVTAHLREFAVVMRRLPHEGMLDWMLAHGSVNERHMRELAKALAAFHASAPIVSSRLWGSPEAISRRIASHLAEARQIAADSLTRRTLDAVSDYANRFVLSHRQILDNRVRDGQVREGHGDLRCESICFEPTRVTIFHCFEGGEEARYADVVSDLAALAVDLDASERPEMASELLKVYAMDTQDHLVDELLPFYKCYRALWRARFETLTSIQTDLPAEVRMRARDNARRLYALAAHYIDGPSSFSAW